MKSLLKKMFLEANLTYPKLTIFLANRTVCQNSYNSDLNLNGLQQHF